MHENLAQRWPGQPRQQAEQRRFAGARGAKQRDEFACAQFQADIIQHQNMLAVLAIIFADALGCQHDLLLDGLGGLVHSCCHDSLLMSRVMSCYSSRKRCSASR